MKTVLKALAFFQIGINMKKKKLEKRKGKNIRKEQKCALIHYENIFGQHEQL